MTEKEQAERHEDKIQKLVQAFHTASGYCDELNIYEWPEADAKMQELEKWVNENFPR